MLHLKVTDQELLSPSILYPLEGDYCQLQMELSLQSRSIDSILADGNCFFRAVSKELLGSQRHHYHIRQVLSKYMKQNPKPFESLVEATHSLSLEKYCDRMASLCKWATEIEIVAAASVFQCKIYIYTKFSHKKYQWTVFTPIKVDKICNPHYGLLQAKKEQPKDFHIELLHFNSTHYDRIASQTGQKIAPPMLEGEIHNTAIVL